MAAGVVCLLSCVLFVMTGLTTGEERLATGLLFVGLVALVAGIVVFGLSRSGNQLRK